MSDGLRPRKLKPPVSSETIVVRSRLPARKTLLTEITRHAPRCRVDDPVDVFEALALVFR